MADRHPSSSSRREQANDLVHAADRRRVASLLRKYAFAEAARDAAIARLDALSVELMELAPRAIAPGDLLSVELSNLASEKDK